MCGRVDDRLPGDGDQRPQAGRRRGYGGLPQQREKEEETFPLEGRLGNR